MSGVILFILIVGIGSSVILDIWVFTIAKCTGSDVPNWGLPGRWVVGMTRREWRLNDATTPPSLGEKMIGWAFHYAVSIVYAVLLIALWGTAYIQQPTFAPAYLIGGVLTTLAGTMIFMPALGNGVMCRKLPGREAVLNRIVVNHTLYAIALYVLALVAASFV